MPIINPRQIYTDELKHDDAAIFTVKILVTRIQDGTPLYRVYNCPRTTKATACPKAHGYPTSVKSVKRCFPHFTLSAKWIDKKNRTQMHSELRNGKIASLSRRFLLWWHPVGC